MTANELRIGNWVVNRHGKLYQIKSGYGLLTSAVNKYQPIPIRPEILEKCGFVHYSYVGITGEIMTDESWDLNHKDGWLNIETDGSIGIAGNRDAYHWASSDLVCRYVHQLQNLYFALTGEELTVNL